MCWGERDPWTPLQRVSALDEFEAVKKLVEPPVQLFFFFSPHYAILAKALEEFLPRND